MRKLFEKKRLWETLALVFAGLLMVMCVANMAIVPFNNEIHTFLGTTDYVETTVKLGEGEELKEIKRPALKTAEEIEAYYRAANDTVEAEGIVLLKNEDNALPLEDGANVSFALSGSAKIFYATHGPGVRRSGEGSGAFFDLKSAIESETTLKVNEKIYDFLANGAGRTNRGRNGDTFVTNETAWSEYTSAGLVDEYRSSGAAVIAVITRESGEGQDVSYKGSDGVDGSYLSLTAQEYSVLEGLAQLKRSGDVSKIIVLINSAVTLQCDFIENELYGIDAAMWIGLPGATGMKAVAKALIGKVNPSGGASDTLLKDNFTSPAAMYWQINDGFSQSYANTEAMSLNSSQQYYGVYVEGVYVGYRYYETRYEDYVLKSAGVGEFDYSDAVAYPFGHGLSYTKFEYSDFKVDEVKEGGKTTAYNVSVTVTNKGALPGKEVVQLYLQKPYGTYARTFGVEKPSVELVGFGKTDVLYPEGSTEGASSQTLTATVTDKEDMRYMKVNFELLRSYDAENAGTYILDEGKYYLTAARNSHDAVNNILALKGYTTADGMDADGSAAMAACVLDNDSVDAEIFAKSSARAHDTPTTLSTEAVNTKIENQLDFMDPNRFAGVTNTAADDGDVTYVSRRDWLGTLPSEKTNLELTNKTIEKYDITSHKTIVEEEGAAMPTFGDMSSDVTLAMMADLKYDDDKWNEILDKISQTDMFLTLTNCYGFTPALASVAKPMTDEDDGPYGVSNTEEGYSSMSNEGVIASSFSVSVYRLVGEAIAADARSGHDKTQKNLHGLYAPGLNIHRVAFGGRAAEYYSEDPVLSGLAALEEIQSMQEQYVVACPKHFIFNDEEINRNGICIWMNEQAAREIYLLPWEYACRSDMGNAHSLMTSFNRAGGLWTSASDNLMENILRGEWAFDGYTLTDMAGSNGKLFMVYDDGFMNGTDCFLDKGLTSGFTSDMRRSNTFNSKLRQSMHRLLYVVANYSAAMDGYSNLTRLQPVAVWWKVLITALTVIFAVLAAAATAMFVVGEVLERKQKKQ